VNVSVIGKNVGALAGSVISGNISNAYAAGNVHGGSDVGGLAGRNYGNISNAYATGKVSGTSYASGLVLADYGKINNSYWNTTSSAMATSAGGTGLTDTQMKQ
jgi:hypothetical protein